MDKDKKVQEPKNRSFLRKAIATGVVGLAALILFFILAVRILGENGYGKLSETLSTKYGLWGIAFYNYICEAFTLPFPTNILFAFVAKMDPWVVIPLIAISGILGNMTAFGYGYILDQIPFIRRQSDKILEKWGYQINHYGYKFILLAGLLPMPFTTICICAGIVQMKPKKLLPCLLIKIVRAFLYFYAFRYGFLKLS